MQTAALVSNCCLVFIQCEFVLTFVATFNLLSIGPRMFAHIGLLMLVM